MQKIEETIIKPILQAMKDNGAPFTGFLYAGLMITDGEPSVIEFNCRLGDPETQVILPLIKNNFFKLLWKAANNLKLPTIKKSDLRAAAFVVKVAEGYPNAYEKGKEIIIDEDVIAYLNCYIVHAGTKREGDKFFTNGGRVIGLLGLGDNLEEAVQETYKGIEAVKFPGEFYRKDIGKL
jgi:phosphoribosylamine--glycine ligase